MAWDATTGDLAVMSLLNGSGTSGDVLVYASGSGSGVPYTNPSQYYYDFGGYDSEGNLFFDGLDTNGNFILSELPRNASSAETIKVSGGTIYYPGMVAWNTAKRELVVGDQSCGNSYASCLYTLGISGKAGTHLQRDRAQELERRPNLRPRAGRAVERRSCGFGFRLLRLVAERNVRLGFPRRRQSDEQQR